MGRKTSVWIFETRNWRNLIRKDLGIGTKGKTQEKNWISSNSYPNNAIRTNYIEAKTDNTQQNSKCEERDETINHIVNECSKLAQKKYKTKSDWVRKIIYGKLCQRLKFDHTTKWYMHKLEHVLVNETRKILVNFKIQTDHQIPTRRPDRVLIDTKKNLPIRKFCSSGGPQSENKRKWNDKQAPGCCQRTK